MKKLSKSLEKYLYTIYKLSKEEKLTPKKLGDVVGCNRASTQEAIKNLQGKELIDFYPYKFILLTEKGTKYAKKIEEKRQIISRFLEKFLFIEEKNIDEIVSEIEFGANDLLISRLSSFLDFLDFCPAGGPSWLFGFKDFLENGVMTDACTNCIEESISNIRKPDCKVCNLKNS